jgi:hypothetical protein
MLMFLRKPSDQSSANTSARSAHVAARVSQRASLHESCSSRIGCARRPLSPRHVRRAPRSVTRPCRGDAFSDAFGPAAGDAFGPAAGNAPPARLLARSCALAAAITALRLMSTARATASSVSAARTSASIRSGTARGASSWSAAPGTGAGNAGMIDERDRATVAGATLGVVAGKKERAQWLITTAPKNEHDRPTVGLSIPYAFA